MATTHGGGSTSPGGLGDELKQDATKLGNVAGDRLSSQAETHKGEIASQARSVSGALEKAAGELGGEDTPDWLRSSLRQGAQSLQRLADGVENKSPRELLDDFNSLGRDHPGVFLGACAIAGFAVARVFKAGASGVSTAQGGSGYRPGGTSNAVAPVGVSQAGAYSSGSLGGGLGGGSSSGAQGGSATPASIRATSQGAI